MPRKITSADGLVTVQAANGTTHVVPVGGILADDDNVISSRQYTVEEVDDPFVAQRVKEWTDPTSPEYVTELRQESVVEPSSIKEVLDRLDRGESLDDIEATAAGLGGGGGQGNSGFVRLLRIAESVDPVSYSYDTSLQGIDPAVQQDLIPQVLDEEPLVPDVTEPPVTEPPVTEPPVTEPPVTEPPVTEPPVTEPPVTEPPVTEPPVTEPPVTEPPVTEPPVTEPPVTEPPVTEPPVTEPPVTDKVHQDNGFGNGDDTAPGNSGSNNNAENAGNQSATGDQYPGNSNNNGNQDTIDTTGVNNGGVNSNAGGNGNGKGPVTKSLDIQDLISGDTQDSSPADIGIDLTSLLFDLNTKIKDPIE
jgi:hypothetical protein